MATVSSTSRSRGPGRSRFSKGSRDRAGRRFRIRVWVACVLVLSCAGVVRAEPDGGVTDRIDRGEQRYGDLEFRAAVAFCSDGARDASATKAEQARGWRCVGLSWLALDQKSLAKEAFGRVFTIDPAYAIDESSLSPRQRAFIEEVRKEQRAAARAEDGGARCRNAAAACATRRRSAHARLQALVSVDADRARGRRCGRRRRGWASGCTTARRAGDVLPPGVVSLGLHVGW